MKNKTGARVILRWGLLVLSLGLVAAGAFSQEFLLVLQKAVKICLECIGIG